MNKENFYSNPGEQELSVERTREENQVTGEKVNDAAEYQENLVNSLVAPTSAEVADQTARINAALGESTVSEPEEQGPESIEDLQSELEALQRRMSKLQYVINEQTKNEATFDEAHNEVHSEGVEDGLAEIQEQGRAAQAEVESEAAEETTKWEAFHQKTANNKGFKKFVTGIIVAATAVTAFSTAVHLGRSKNTDNSPIESRPGYTMSVGERESNELHTDYEGATFTSDKKNYANDVGENLDEFYNNPAGMTEEVLRRTDGNPNSLASYANQILTPAEKAELGIADKNDNDVRDIIEVGGESFRQRVYESFKRAIKNSDVSFEEFTGATYTLTENWDDLNKDGKPSINEITAGHFKVNRVNDKRVTFTYTSDSGEVTKLTIRLDCGGNVEYDVEPGTPVAPPTKIIPPVTTTETTTEKKTPPTETPPNQKILKT